MLSEQTRSVQPHYIDRGIRIADDFDAMRHDPHNPLVAVSYQQFVTEIISQFQYVIDTLSITVEPWFSPSCEPYATSRLMIADVKNKHLFFLPTINAFGSEQGLRENPLLELTDYVINGYRLCANDCFRAVHDIFGHFQGNNPFGPRGEEAAWCDHLPWFSLLAQPALTTETRGQSSWFFFGSHLRDDDGRVAQFGEAGFIPYQQRPFADQKIGLLPPDVSGVELTQTDTGILALPVKSQTGITDVSS